MSPSKEEAGGVTRLRLLPPPSASWWAIDTTIRCTRQNLTGLIRVRYQDGAGPAVNRVVHDLAFPRPLASPYRALSLTTQTIESWFEYHSLLKEWEL